jgi:hypothetical protein
MGIVTRIRRSHCEGNNALEVPFAGEVLCNFILSGCILDSPVTGVL